MMTLDQKIVENSKLIEEVVFDLVKQYTKPLDDIMELCQTIFQSSDKASNQELEDLLAQLPSTLYFTNEGLETIGIRQDIAEITKKNKYNLARMEATGTIADKNATAEGAITVETLNEVIYQRTYKIIKNKIEMGQEMINSLKRIFDARMMDIQIGYGVKK